MLQFPKHIPFSLCYISWHFDLCEGDVVGIVVDTCCSDAEQTDIGAHLDVAFFVFGYGRHVVVFIYGIVLID